jgi:hypothetical protein
MMMMMKASKRDSTFRFYNFYLFPPESRKFLLYIVKRIDLYEFWPYWTFPATHHRERVCLPNRKESDCDEANFFMPDMSVARYIALSPPPERIRLQNRKERDCVEAVASCPTCPTIPNDLPDVSFGRSCQPNFSVKRISREQPEAFGHCNGLLRP